MIMKGNINKMNESVQRKIDETYKHLHNCLDALYECEELTKMCETCKLWEGKKHNYENCKNKPCFRNWLAVEYLYWCAAWE